VRAANGSERHVRLRPRTIIGRAEDCDIYFPDHLLSRHHAEIELRPDGCYLVDLDSTNGTFLNGRLVESEQRLTGGDVITAGEATLVFHEVEAPAGEGADAITTGARITRRIIDVPELVRDDRVLGALCRVTNALVAHAALP